MDDHYGPNFALHRWVQTMSMHPSMRLEYGPKAGEFLVGTGGLWPLRALARTRFFCFSGMRAFFSSPHA